MINKDRSIAAATAQSPSAGSHVAIISFGYPPIPHVCATRASEMGAALATLGYLVTTITVDWRSEGNLPKVCLERGVNVVRIDPREWFPEFDPCRLPFATQKPSSNTLIRRLYTLASILSWGVNGQWARRALEGLVEIHNTHPVDVVWAIHGDDSSHELAAKFSRKTGVPWIADFKDPWNVYHQRYVWPVLWFITWRRLQSCSILTETSSGQGQLDAGFGKDWRTVWSGFDEFTMRTILPVRASDRFSVVYLGHADARHNVSRAVQVLKEWLRTRPDVAIELHVYGHGSGIWRRAVETEGICDVLHAHEFIPKHEALARMKGADVLLLLPMGNFGQSRIQVGVKELEYLASGTPVLCIGSMLRELREAFGEFKQVVEVERNEHAFQFLDEEYAAFLAGAVSKRRSSANTAAIAAYSWPSQAARLADVFDSVLGTRESSFAKAIGGKVPKG